MGGIKNRDTQAHPGRGVGSFATNVNWVSYYLGGAGAFEPRTEKCFVQGRRAGGLEGEIGDQKGEGP